MTLELFHNQCTPIFTPWCAGDNRDERLVRKYCCSASIMPRNPTNLPYRHSGGGRNPEEWGGANVVRSKTSRGEGLVPRWGGGGAWQNPPCQSAPPSHNSSFSYLRVPAPAGMSDCYESMSRTPIRDRLPRLISSFQRRASPVPRSGAGIQKRWGGVRRPDDQKTGRRITIFILLCGFHKPMVIPAKSQPRTPIRGRIPRDAEAWHPMTPKRVQRRAPNLIL